MSAERKRSTRNAYAKRVGQLLKAAAAELGGEHLSEQALVDWLIAAKRPALSPASWRQYRAAVVWALERRASKTGDDFRLMWSLIERLKEVPPNPVRPTERRTSAQKAKKLPQNDFVKIVLTARLAGAKDARALEAYLNSGRLTGLRPGEWLTARLVKNPKHGFKWALIAPCAKKDDFRAHSETRTLFFRDMPARLEESLLTWLVIVEKAVNSGTFEKLLNALGSLMRRVTRQAFPRRKSFPTLYSTRHAAAARWKYFYIERHSDPVAKLEGSAIVAALLGHASDETATQHYARARRSGDEFPIPEPDPDEVARVRRRLSESQRNLWRAVSRLIRTTT